MTDPFPKVTRKVPVILSLGEVALLLDSLYNIKHRAMMMTAYAAGLRTSEVTHLKVSDIDSLRNQIVVRHGSKGGKERCVMLSPLLLACLREYWRLERPGKDWLFPGATPGKPIEPETLRKVCHQAVEKANLKKKVTVRSLRHAFATHLLESGANIRLVQVLMGHASLSSTALYTHISQALINATKSPLDLLPRPTLVS